jgi:hypothetical protein
MRRLGVSIKANGVVLPVLICNLVKYKTTDKPIIKSNKPINLRIELLTMGSFKRLFNNIKNSGIIIQMIITIVEPSRSLFTFTNQFYHKI